MKKRQKTLARWAFWFLAAAAAVISWWQFLWPPVSRFLKKPDAPGLVDLLGQLIQPRNAVYEEPMLGWAFILVTIALGLVVLSWIRSISDYLQNSRVGLSVLETVMEVEMQTADRSMAVIRRKQSFHANRRGITAYRYNSQTDAPGGRILRNTLKQSSQVANRSLTKELITRGSDSNLEIIEVFSQELPTSLVATFLPNWIVCALHSAGIFNDVVVMRSGETTFQNEFDGPEGVYSVSTTKYPISRTIIRVAFVVGHEPPADQVRGFLMRENVVEEVALTVTTTQTHTIYEVRASTLHMESLRVQWNF